MLVVESFKVGPLETNCYLIVDKKTQRAAIIDPGGISVELDKKIHSLGEKNVDYILMTHGHFDHIRKATRYKKLTGAKLMIGVNEAEFTKNRRLNLCRIPIEPFEADVLLNNGNIISLGETKIKVINTPGHTVGGVCFIAEDFLFSGDTIMRGTIGRYDLETGNFNQMRESIKKILDLSKNYIIYPGHGEPTTLQEEKICILKILKYSF